MAADNIAEAARFKLPFHAESELPPKAPPGQSDGVLPEHMLIRNLVWFCQLRWVVVAVLAGFGFLSLFPRVFQGSSLQPQTNWPFLTAVVLAGSNLVYLWHIRGLNQPGQRPHGAQINMWVQIAMDLLILTWVVHFVGSCETHVAFTYLLHIVLACMFVSRRQSLGVTVLACVLYGACLAMEQTRVIPPSGLFCGTVAMEHVRATADLTAINYFSAVGIWLVVWYLTSHLSAMVRARDSELGESNYRLRHAQMERTTHMLRTTHELKAPFAGIQANTQLLLEGSCGPLSEDAESVVQLINTRCQQLVRGIQDMLQLANLGSVGQKPPALDKLDLAEVLRSCVAQVERTARQRDIVIEEDIHPAPTTGIEDHLKMLFGNVLSNAVCYSHDGGQVRVKCRQDGEGFLITISDDGIGIVAKKMPRIFEAHYRTKEATRHNKGSSGLGLAIVRQVAQRHGIHLWVESTLGIGTTFELRFPPPHDTANGRKNKELRNGLSNDC